MNNSPYSVLGISENASEAEIKDAYRSLARKYQAELSKGSPYSDDARRKMEELDMAYDRIMQLRSGAGANNSSYYGSQNNYDAGYNGNSQFYDVRDRIKEGRIDDAETILDGIPKDMRSAEWYYLKGQIQQRRGWFDEAYKNYSKACQKEPQNPEYTNAFNALNNNANGGYRQTRRSSDSDCSTCDICSGLICADCCCESLGGDLIPCC